MSKITHKKWSKAVKVVYNGEKFDSKAELKYYLMLKELLEDGRIRKIEKQVRFTLPDMKGGKRFSYTCDFVVTTLEGFKVYLEVKGRMMPGNALRYAYWQQQYGETLTIIPTSGPFKFNLDWLTKPAD